MKHFFPTRFPLADMQANYDVSDKEIWSCTMPPFIIQLYPFKYFMSHQYFYWFANFCQVIYCRT